MDSAIQVIRLEAESARLREELRLSQECEAILQRQLAAAQLDAARLDWLLANPVEALDMIGKLRQGEARFVRTTIDAAMKEQS